KQKPLDNGGGQREGGAILDSPQPLRAGDPNSDVIRGNILNSDVWRTKDEIPGERSPGDHNLDTVNGTISLEQPDMDSKKARKVLNEMLDKLRKGSLKRAFDEHSYYIPNDHFMKTMNQEAIEAILRCTVKVQDKAAKDYEQLVEDVYGQNKKPVRELRRILTILILMDRDKKLGTESRDFQLCVSRAPSDPIELFKSWKHKDIEEFETTQWETLAPNFLPERTKEEGWVQHHQFSKRQPLPFEIIPEPGQYQTVNSSAGKRQSRSSIDGMKGAHSIVWKVKVHPSHHKLSSYRLISTTDKDTFNNEVRVLKDLNQCNNPHLVKLILTMELLEEGKGSSFWLFFPLADGNLDQFWRNNLRFSDTERKAHARWLAQQFHGLAQALSNLHRLNPAELGKPENNKRYGIHGDIKPANLLWYGKWKGQEDHDAPRKSITSDGIIPPQSGGSDRPLEQPNTAASIWPRGVIQLADFGITSLHQTETRGGNAPRRLLKIMGYLEFGLRVLGMFVLARPRGVWG
ncbi:hypothetical protein MMYC01_202227, partial [Madurella mycetomatis]